MSKDMGFFVYPGNIAGGTPGYMHGEIQRSISSASSLSPILPKKQTIAARQSKTLAGGYISLVVPLIGRSLTPLAAPQNV